MKKREPKFLRAFAATLTVPLLLEGMPSMALPVSAAVDYGWEEENSSWYWYENGVRQGYDPNNPDYRGKEIYDPASDAWYWLDNVQDGAKAVNKDVYQESEAGQWADKADGTGKWVRYDEYGHMIKSWSTNEKGTYYFDPVYGTMAKGYATIDGVEYCFDEGTGVMLDRLGEVPENGWKELQGKQYWYESYVRQGFQVDDSYRGKEIYDPASDAWYWLDNVQDGAKAVNKDVYQESEAGQWADKADGTGKWVRYDENGYMIKGWSTNEKGTYYFDPVYGTMAKGVVTIDDTQYEFDRTTGILLGKPESEYPESDVLYQGKEYGLTWWISKDGNLTVTGTCDSTEEIYWDIVGWAQYKDSIRSASLKFSGAKTLAGLFSGYSNLTSVDLSCLDTSSVAYMSYMFSDCSALTGLDLSSFDTSSVTDMSGMFSYCTNLTSLDLSSFDTSFVTNMSCMFSGCYSLTGLDLSSFDTSSVTDMSSMFTVCSDLSSLNLSSFDTGCVTNMTHMFNACSSLSSLDLSSFDTGCVASMRGMFYECSKLSEISASPKWKINDGTDTSYMFDNCGVKEVTLN